MDIDHHMEMMLMPDFSCAYEDINENPMVHFNEHLEDSDDNNTDPVVFEHVNSPTFMNNISFSGGEPSEGGFLQQHSSGGGRWENDEGEKKNNSMAAMREMIFRIAAMQPIHIDPESVKPPKRKNVKISTDPQSVAARHRRERISERIRILQRLVPGGTKMDTASMLDEAIHYVKFLKNQVQSLEQVAVNRPEVGIGFPVPMTSGNYFPVTAAKGYHCQFPMSTHNVLHLGDS